MDERDEYLQKEEAQSGELFEELRGRIRRRNTLIIITGAIIAALILAVALFFGARAFFSVDEIEVTGTSAYEAQRIIAESGVKKGDVIFFISSSKTQNRLLGKFPMLESVAVKKSYPRRIVIETVDETPLFLYETGDGSPEYAVAVVARSEKLIGFYPSVEAAKSENLDLMIVRMPQVKKAEKGQNISYFSPGDAGYIADLIDNVRHTDLGAEVELIDVRSRFDIRVQCGMTEKNRPKYDIYLGNKDKLPEKLAFAGGIIRSLDDSFEGIVSVEDVKNGYAQKYRD